MYTYKAYYRSNYDGDTVRLDVDLGFNVWKKNVVIRLFGIDSPELRRPTLDAGRAAKHYLRALIDGQALMLTTHKDKKGKYGRWLGEITVIGLSTSVTRMMVDAGHAVYRDY